MKYVQFKTQCALRTKFSLHCELLNVLGTNRIANFNTESDQELVRNRHDWTKLNLLSLNVNLYILGCPAKIESWSL